jgi:3-oxoacyl-[acyl-carrier protein] reductase
MLRKRSRSAIVTGASDGIGQEVALRLARDGMNIVVNHASNATEADRTVAAIRREGRQAVAVQADIADDDAMAKVFETAHKEFGGIDVVVNSAGIMVPGTIADTDVADLDRMYRTNIRGTYVVGQLAANWIHGGGSIINLLSPAGRRVSPGYEAYAVSKGAIEALTVVLASAMRRRNVSVNSIAPVRAASTRSLERAGRIAQIVSFSSKKRVGDPEDIAEIVSFLTGAGRWFTGQTFFVSGGGN